MYSNLSVGIRVIYSVIYKFGYSDYIYNSMKRPASEQPDIGSVHEPHLEYLAAKTSLKRITE